MYIFLRLIPVAYWPINKVIRVQSLVRGVLKLHSLIRMEKLDPMILWMIVGMLMSRWRGWPIRGVWDKWGPCWQVIWFMKPQSIISDHFTLVPLIIAHIALIHPVIRMRLRRVLFSNRMKTINPRNLFFFLILWPIQEERLLAAALQKIKVLLVSEKKEQKFWKNKFKMK